MGQARARISRGPLPDERGPNRAALVQSLRGCSRRSSGRPRATACPVKPDAHARVEGSRLGRDRGSSDVVANARRTAPKLSPARLALVLRESGVGLGSQKTPYTVSGWRRRGARGLPRTHHRVHHSARARLQPRCGVARARSRSPRLRPNHTSSFLWRLSTHTRRSSFPLPSSVIVGVNTPTCPFSSILPPAVLFRPARYPPVLFRPLRFVTFARGKREEVRSTGGCRIPTTISRSVRGARTCRPGLPPE